MLIRHSVIYLLGRIIPGAVSLLTLAAFTRIMSAEQYGHYALLITAAGFINAVFFQWLNLSIGRFLPAYAEQSQILLSTAIVGYAVTAAIIGAVGGAVAWLWPDHGLRWMIVLAVFLGWSQAWFDLNLRVTNAKLAPIRYGLLSSVKALAGVSIGVILFHFGLGVVGILLGLIVALVLSPLMFSHYWHHISVSNFKPQVLKNFISYGTPLTLSLILTLVIDASDRLFLGWFLDARAVGAYAPAYDLAQLSLGMLMSVVHLAAFPLVVKELEEKGVAAARNAIQENAVLLLAFALPSTLGLVMLADNIAFVVMGGAFQEDAKKIIPVIALAIFASGVRSFYFDYSFQLGKKIRGQILAILFGAIVNVTLNILWIPKYGVLGAAYATLGAFVAAMLVSMYLGRKVFRLPPLHRDLSKLLLAAGAMAASLHIITGWRGTAALVVQVGVGAAIYFSLLFVLNVGELRFKVFRRKTTQ